MFKLNEVTRRRIAVFRRRKPAVISLYIFGVMFVIGMCSELVANNKPYVIKYDGSYYFPMVRRYHPTTFGVTNVLIMDYKQFVKTQGDEVWALFPPIRWSPYEINTEAPELPSPPSKENLFGTDQAGRDVLTRIIYGFRVSMGYSLAVWLMSFAIGTFFGSIQGYFGGRVDFLGQRVIEVYSAIPYFLLLITLIAFFEPNIWTLALLASLFGWVSISYYMRAEFLRLRNFDFVEASRALGAPTGRTLFKHILPNALNPIITFSPFTIAGGVMALASLDYLGFGVQPPTASWGELLNQGVRLSDFGWWIGVFPALALFATLTMLNLIGEGVRVAFDPKKSY